MTDVENPLQIGTNIPFVTGNLTVADLPLADLPVADPVIIEVMGISTEPKVEVLHIWTCSLICDIIKIAASILMLFGILGSILGFLVWIFLCA
jgi:hypothetical protein